jgi:hypothetical protein
MKSTNYDAPQYAILFLLVTSFFLGPDILLSLPSKTSPICVLVRGQDSYPYEATGKFNSYFNIRLLDRRHEGKDSEINGNNATN